MDKIIVYHFHNGSGGGVLSVIQNLLRYSRNKGVENHVIYTINQKIISDFKIPSIEGSSSQQIFYYDPSNNFYFTCKQLAKLFPHDRSVIVAHDWLELGMASNLGLPNPVVQVVHGNYEYYHELAQKHDHVIDKYITVSPAIKKNLCKIIPERVADIYYQRFPVAELLPKEKDNMVLNVFYCVRNLLDDNKQFNILPLINEKLKRKGIQVNWTIIGEGVEKQNIENLMDQYSGITLYPSLPNEEVIKLLPEHDLMILPSLNEGFPCCSS